jgi:TPR repeat protein
MLAPAQARQLHAPSLRGALQGRADAGIVPAMKTRLAMLIGTGCLCAGLLLAAPASAAPPLPAAQQNRLDLAVLDYESGRVDAARGVFEALAREGVAAAQYNLAVMNARGEIPHASPARALRLLTQAARGGFVTAQLMLGRAYEIGQFGPRDLKLAARWYEVAATAGSVEAQLETGTAYYLGRGAPKAPAKALHWYREAANGGDVGAQYLLASMYEHGEGTEPDLRLARYWYDIAAKNGDVAAPDKLREIDAKIAASPD